MYRITARTTLIVSTGFTDSGEFINASEDFLRSLDGFVYDPDFGKIAEFINFNGPELSQEGPSITLKFNDDIMLLEAVSVFIVDSELSELQLNAFKEEYDGQMSDGMGSGMNQELSDVHELDFEVYWLYEDKYKSQVVQSEMAS